MSVVLRHANGVSIRFRNVTFYKLLELATGFDWRPQTAVPIPQAHQNRRYKYVQETYVETGEVPDALNEHEFLEPIEDTEYEDDEFGQDLEPLALTHIADKSDLDCLLFSYYSNDGHWVTKEDAFCLADALAKALGDIPPREDAYTVPTSTLSTNSKEDPYEVPPFRFFYGGGTEVVRGMIRFCRAGGFFID